MRKNLIFVVILLFAVSLTFMWARGAEEDTDADAEAAAANFNATGLPIVNEPVTYTVAHRKYANDQAEDQNMKECVRVTEEKTNVKFEWQDIMHTAWSEKVNLLFAADNLPDTFFGQVDIASRMDFLTELGPLIEQYAPNITELFSRRPDLKDLVTAPDGKIYSVPTGEEAIFLKHRNYMFMNKVWLDKVGLDVPETLEEFETVLRAFKDEDPNGNGKRDEVPFSTFDDPNKSIYQFFGSFGVPTDKYYLMVNDGNVTFTPKDKRFYDGLIWLNEMVSEGLIDREALTQTVPEYRTKGDVLGSAYDLAIYNAVGNDEADDYIIVPQLVGPSGDSLVRVNPGSTAGGAGINPDRFVITKGTETPEALIRFVDYINKDISTKLLWTYSDSDTGLWKLVPEENGWKAVMPEDLEVPFGVASYSSAVPAAPVFLPYESNRKFEGLSIMFFEAGKEYEKDAVQEWIPAGIWEPKAQKEMQRLFTDIDNYMQSFITNSILNGITEEKWANHLKQFEKLRVDEYVALHQEFYDSVKN
jgi:putative aldouronate transport system substrate-binding protein